MRYFLTHFSSIRPEYETSQEDSLNWLIAAHSLERPLLEKEKMALLINKMACKKNAIQKRGYSIPDFLHQEWNKMTLFNLTKKLSGEGLKERSLFFKEKVDEIFKKFYPKKEEELDDLIHVTCTGYVAPSAAQKIVSLHNMKNTTVTHAYHMGCMASIAALRMAQGFLSANKSKKRVDIVHTEMCSLHINPSLNTAEQVIAESLFADGFIKYSLTNSSEKGFELLTVLEEIIPATEKAMEWQCEDWGMRMTLSKDIPRYISQSLKGFVDRLMHEAQLKIDMQQCFFAIHPGGPKIIDRVKEALNLTEKNVEKSKEVLYQFGNMSSATVPHILERMEKDCQYKPENIMIALAFGPGITLSGAILRKL